MTSEVPAPPDIRRVRMNAVLYVVAMVAAAAVVVASVLLWREVTDDSTPTALPEAGVVPLDEGSEEEQERFAGVIDSATEVTTAFINIRHDDAESSIEAVMAGATGEFRDQYAKSTDDIIRLLKQNQSISEGKVVWTGVVASDQDSATVVVATSGTVANKASKNKPIARYYRLQLELVLEKGRWLTRDLQFVP